MMDVQTTQSTRHGNLIPLNFLRYETDSLGDAPKVVRTFVRAHHRFEQSGRVGALIALFSEEVEIQSDYRLAPVYGIAGAYRYWREYMFEYQRIETRFHRVVRCEADAQGGEEFLLEWEAEATLSRGERVQIRGITVLRYKDDRIVLYRSFSNRAAYSQMEARKAA